MNTCLWIKGGSSAVVCAVLATSSCPAAEYELLKQEFDLAGERSLQSQHYRIEHRFIHYAEDGQRQRVETFRCYLKAWKQNRSTEEYVCRKFTVQVDAQAERAIPALTGWTYTFNSTKGGLDRKGRVFGIDHGKFEKLTDDTGTVLSDDVAYRVYNSFIDFNSFCNVFAQATPSGKGIQDLKTIGQKIVHDAAFSKPPVDLGEAIGKGSSFQNGEITLLLKGLSLVGDRACAIVAFDSGESSFAMKLGPTPDIEVNVVGGSHYHGDLYVDLESKWVKKVAMSELVVTRITVGGKKVAHGVIERITAIESISGEKYRKS